MTADSAALELYGHAIAIEREAADRYAELASAAAAQGDAGAARVFARLARLDARHLHALRRRIGSVRLPPLEADHSWPLPHDPGISAHDAALVALQAERRARAFFEHVMRTTQEEALRALAREMATEESERIAELARL